MKFRAPRGTYDTLPGEAEKWVWLEETFRRVCRLYGYKEIRTPTFEDTALFVRGIGEATDIVSKEMYTFLDKSGRSLTLKPEGTAPTIRAYIENHLGSPDKVTKLFYITPIFRYERPQEGRMRESHQTGVELIGSAHPDADAEVIELTVRFYRELGLDEVTVKLNSLGNVECRSRFRQALLQFAKPVLEDLPADFKARCEKNPLRLLDSKDEEVKRAMASSPSILSFLEDDSKDHFEAVQKRLSALGVSFELDDRLVRGLDYYTRTVFEVQSGKLGAQNALCGGGRYDNLIEECGGQPTPAVGVAMGIERALMVLGDAAACAREGSPVFAVCLTDRRDDFARIVQALRDANIAVETDLQFRSAKSQFRQADKAGVKYAVVIGDTELESGLATVKDLQTGLEERILFESLPDLLT